jgi:antitoxin FitA
MPSIMVRNLDSGVVRRLRARAAESGRSVEQEAKSIIEAAFGGRQSFSPFGMIAQFEARFGDAKGGAPDRPPAQPERKPTPPD